ncbi:MAG: cytochrome b N-terminal domain-containing protein [bacterium]|nr:cytochrome b N-terminal domain-containing protein [bacterium]
MATLTTTEPREQKKIKAEPRPKKPNHTAGFKELIHWFTPEGFREDFLQKRLGISESLLQTIERSLHPKKKIHFSAYTGWLITFLFAMECISGVFLMIYYHPTVAEAFENVRYITNIVPYGWLIRGVHFWGSHLMIGLTFLHLLQTFIRGGYKPPREVTWISGVVLLILTLAFGLTGYLLPWNQISYWASTVVTEVPMAFPYIGHYLKVIARGGENVSQVTLTRFFTMHVTVLPALTTFFLVVHFLPIRNYLIPKDLITHAIAILLCFALLISLATLSPAPIHEKADPYHTPKRVKAEWYFLAGQEILELAGNLEFLGSWAPKLLGVLFQMAIIALLFLIPFIDRNPARNPKKRPLAIALISLGFVCFIFLTLFAKFR